MLRFLFKILQITIVLAFVLASQPLQAQTNFQPGEPPFGEQREVSVLEMTDNNALTLVVQEFGQLRLSVDAAGTLGDSSIIQVEKPTGAKVRKAYLMAATTGFTNFRLNTGDIKLQGSAIAWSQETFTSINSYNYWTDVTAIVKPVVDAATPGLVNLTITESNSTNIDGEVLVVILDDPNQATENTILLYFGAQNVNGDNFVIEFGTPVDKADPNFLLDLSLGISYGYQVPIIQDQFSLIDVNGQRLTSSAGGQDDGEPSNGGLITAGGIGDLRTNPADPSAPPANARTDDELYDLRSFVNQNDTSVQINTLNPSDDDNIFFAGVFLGATRSIGTVDLDISLYNNPTTILERAPYEAIIRYFADGVYESSNGAHKLGTVTFYPSGAHASDANIFWVQTCHPNANISGYGTDGLHINMCDVFTNNIDFMTNDASQKGGGYTLAHEFGHYYYSLYDEYKGTAADNSHIATPRASDSGVANSMMHSQWNARGGDFNWLNFSIAKNNTKKNAHDRVYDVSGWETLARPVADDPRDGARNALPTRLFHQELSTVAPAVNTDARIDLPGDARSSLRIVWDSAAVTNRSLVAQASELPFSSQLTSILGQNIAYPNPMLLLAFVHTNLMVADLSIQANVTLPNGEQRTVDFADDGVSPDATAGDGLYSAIVAYEIDGTYTIDVAFDNNANTADYVSTSFTPPLGPNGNPVAILAPIPVNENFQLAKSLQVVVSNVVGDDHSHALAEATEISNDNIGVAGRIDYAGDKDVFQFTALDGQPTYVRVTDCALNMIPHLRVFASDGTTLLFEGDLNLAGNNYLSTPLLDRAANSLLYAEVSHVAPAEFGGLYKISAGRVIASDPALPPAQVTVAATPSMLVADGQSTSTIVATVKDQFGATINNQEVNFTTSLGALSAVSATTDISGMATIVLRAATTPGIANIMASTGLVNGSRTVTFTVGPPSSLTVSAQSTSIFADSVSNSIITVNVRDAFNNPIPNQAVAFTTNLGTIVGSATTDATGTAVTTLTAAAIVGTATITASTGPASATTTVTFVGNSISGVLFLDLNRNGVKDVSEGGIANAQVIIMPQGGGTAKATTTASNGSYTVADLPLGNYVVTITPPAGFALTTGNSFIVSLGVSGADTPDTGASLAVFLPLVNR